MEIQAAGLGTTPDYRKPEEEKRSTLAEHMTQESTQEVKPTLRDSVLSQVAGGINDPATIQPNTLPINDQQWNLISRAASESEDPDAYLARYGAALTFSKEYGIPVDAALENLDELSSYLTGEPFKANKTGVQAIVDSFNTGRINMQYSDLAYKFKQADLKGEDTSTIMTQLEEYADQMVALQDHQPRNIATTMLKWTAEGAIPYMIEVGKSSLIGATAAGALATGFTAATGVALGSLAAATPWSLAAIISMGATVGAVNRTRELTEGVTYLQLRELGIDKDIANMGSRTIGMVVGAIEAGLGIEVGTVVKAVGGEQAVTAAASKATAKLIGSGKLGTFIQGVAALGVNATNEAIEEMSEEVAEYLVRHVSYAWQETRGPIDPMPDENLMRDTLQAGLMGFGSAIVLGAPSAMMDSGISIRQQSAMRQDAKTIPSKEAFVNAMSDVRPENIEAADWSNTMSTLWEREHKGKTESSSIKSDQAAYNELDSGKGKTPSGTVRRLNSGRLYTAESENTTVDTSGAEHRRLLVGDPVSGARYGYIDYSVKDNDLAINDVMVRSGYENMRKEAVLDLIEKYPGYEVTWEAKGEALAEVRQQIIDGNPRGKDGGLQYRDGITDVDERLAIEKQIERAMPNLSAPERAVGAILVQLRAESEGTSAQGWLDSHFRDGQLFGDNSEIGKAMQGKRGAVSFDQDLKAIIYAGENADFSTFAHETFHVMLRNMDQIDQFRQAVSEAAATPEFMTWLSEHAQIFAEGYFAGMDTQQLADVAAAFSQDQWGRTQEEFAARLYEGYLADGKTASTRLQQLFQQIAQWMAQIYTTLKHSVDLDPRIIEVFDSLSDKQSPLAKQLVTQEANNGQIKSEALYQGDEGFMKAPNGKPTKLTERQWMQVRTPEFIKWFGDWMNDPENASKVVDENGEPKVMYHGTKSDPFTTFDPEASGRGIIYTTEELAYAEDYTKDSDGNVMEVFVNMRHPADPANDNASIAIIADIHKEDADIVLEAFTDGYDPYELLENPKIITALKEKGYDGVVFYEEMQLTHGVFDSDQIKSATGNQGTFDGENPNILFQEAPPDYQPKSTGIGYKVFVQKDGKLYPPMVANPNGEGTPVGKWLLADEAPIAAYSKTGRPQVKSGGKGTQGRSGLLAYRPGWHLGEIPYAKQFNRLNPATGIKELFPKDFVWAEVEYSKDNDYNDEARQNGVSKNGGFNHALASLHRMPTDGFYNYRTNPDPTTDPWVITGAMKVNKILTREEVETIVKDAGREPQKVEGDNILFQEDGKPVIETGFPKRPEINLFDYFDNIDEYTTIMDTWKSDLKAWVENAPDLLQFGNEDLVHVIHENVRPGEGPWRSTSFINFKGEWIPSGHSAYDTKYEAVKEGMELKDYRPDILFQEAPPTDSEAFKAWFGDSKVVDDEGKPLIVYHNTTERFNAFDLSKARSIVEIPGFFFTNDRHEYSDMGPRQIQAYVSIQNPYEGNYSTYKGIRGNSTDDAYTQIRQALIDDGYDGIIQDEDGVLEVIAFSPEQIKSVSNRGTWDATNPNMLFQDGPPITEAVLDDARGMESWEEFMSFYQAFSFGEEVPTDEAWYKQVFNEANGIVVADEVAQERVEAAHRQLQDEDAKDQYMRDQLSTDEGVVDFLGKLGYMLSPRTLYDTEGDPVFRETVEELQREAESLVHPTVLANAYRVKGGSQPTQRAIKSVRTLMTGDAVRYYRDIYALVMEDLELRPEVIDSRLPAISDPGINTLDNLSITERLKLANRIEATELKKALLSGEEKLDGAAEKIIRDLDLQIQELNEKISEHETTIDESTKKFNETERSLLWAYRDQREAKKQLDEQISKVRKLTDQGRRISKEELKRTHDLQDKLKLLDNQVMAMRESMKEKSKAQHQAAMDSLRQRFKEKSAEQRAAANTKRKEAVSEAQRKAAEKATLAREAATLKRQEALAEQKHKSSEKAAEARLQATVARHEALDKLKSQLTEKQKQKAEAQKVRKYKLDVARRIMAKPSDAINYEQAMMIYELQAALDPAYRRESTLIDGAEGQRRVSIDDARELFSGSSREEIIDAIGLRMYEWIADERRPLNEWTVAELEDLAERVGNLRAEGRRILASKRERQQSIARQYQESIMRSLIATGKYQDRPIVGSLDDQKEKTSPFRTVKALRYSTLPMRAKAMMLDNNTQGTAYNLLVTRKRDAQAVEWTAVELRQKPVIDLMKQVGLTEQDLYKTVGVSLDTNTSTRFTYSALMYIWLSQFDVDNRNAVAYGNLVTQSEKANLHEDNGMIMALGDERYRNLLQQAEYHLNQDDGRYMQVLERVREDFNGQRDRINEVAIREFNKPLRKVDEYLPIHRREFNGENMHEQIADDWFNQNAGGSPTGVGKGFTRDRIKISPNHQRPVNLDLMQVWNRSVRDQEHFIAFAEYGRELNRVFKNPDSVNLRNVISRTLGQEMVSDIHDYMNQVINPQRNIELAGAQKAIRFMRGNLGAAYLTWKMSSLVLQTITSPAPFLQEVKPIYMAKGYIELFSHPLEAIDWINEKSPMMKNRTMSVIIDEILQQSRTYQQNKVMHGVRKMQEIGGLGLTMVDRYAVAGGWLGAYHQQMDALMEQGMTSEQAERMAIAWADDITLKTQPTGDVTEIAPLFTSGGEFARAFMQFTTSLNVIWTNLTYDMPVSAREAMNKTAPKDARMAQFSRVMGTIVGYGLAGAVLGAVADGYDDDDDEIDKLRKWIYWSTTQANESVPLFGNHVSEIIKTLVTGDKPDFFADEFFPGMMKIFKGVGYLAKGKFTKALDNLAQGAGYMGGVPVSGIKQAIKTVKEGPGAMLGR